MRGDSKGGWGSGGGGQGTGLWRAGGSRNLRRASDGCLVDLKMGRGRLSLREFK
jgi:hypothetical protein